VANTYAHIYAREDHILAIRMIVLEEWVYNVYKNLKMKTLNNTFHTWWHEQQFFVGCCCNRLTFFNTMDIAIVDM